MPYYMGMDPATTVKYYGTGGSSSAAQGSEATAYGAVPEHLAALLKDVTDLQARLRYDMHDGLAGAPGAGYNAKHGVAAANLTKLTVDLSRELRAWTKTTREKGRTLSLGERIQLTVAFVSSLSVADRREFDRQLAASGSPGE